LGSFWVVGLLVRALIQSGIVPASEYNPERGEECGGKVAQFGWAGAELVAEKGTSVALNLPKTSLSGWGRCWFRFVDGTIKIVPFQNSGANMAETAESLKMH
jgi:hypothetical protein